MGTSCNPFNQHTYPDTLQRQYSHLYVVLATLLTVHCGSPATPGAARGDSSTASTGSQSPEYTFRGRTQSFTSANGSDGYSSQYAATQAHGRPSQNYMVNSASAHVVQASYQGASNLPGSMTALTLGTHGQSSEYAQRPTVQAGQAAGLPQGRDWYQTNRSGRRPSINYSESNSQPGASGPSSLHPHLRRAFRATSGEYEELDPSRHPRKSRDARIADQLLGYKKRPSKWFKPMRVSSRRRLKGSTMFLFDTGLQNALVGAFRTRQ